MSSEIHVILENYKTISIKSATRKRRQGSVGQLCRIVSDEQPLPEMKDFWNRTENKMSLQNCFVNYCATHYRSSKPLYIAGGLSEDPAKCSLIIDGNVTDVGNFRATHEEADDRIMFCSIQQINQRNTTSKTLTVVTSDTDIITVLLYHLKNTWPGTALYVLKKGRVKS